MPTSVIDRDLLTKAARTMRLEATALMSVYGDPWVPDCDDEEGPAEVRLDDIGIGYCTVAEIDQGEHSEAIARHLASFGHPTVALALADWLDDNARESYCAGPREAQRAETVARTYLVASGDLTHR